MRHTLYHSLLRVSSLTVALVLLFESGVINPVTKELSHTTHEYLSAAVGATASVSPTELNQATAKLTQMERDLDAREAAIREREIAVNLNTAEGGGDSDTAVYILSVILFILLVLIILNYFLDYLRRNPAPEPVHEKAA